MSGAIGHTIGVRQAEKARHADVTFETETVSAGSTIKAGHYIESCSVLITEAFEGGNSPALLVGDSQNLGGYASLSASDIGGIQRVITNGAAYSGSLLSHNSNPIVTITGNPAAGAATVVITTRPV